MSINHGHSLHPITALEFYHEKKTGTLILAGEGPFLKVFEAQSSKLVSQCEVFEGQTIHGIAFQEVTTQGDGLQIVIWGGSSLVLFTKRDFDRLLGQDVSSCTGTLALTADWILDATISPDDDGTCVLVTAHNTVIRARLGTESGLGVISLETLHSPSRSILYSAHLIWSSYDGILVAAGTVFGEIVVWKCPVPEDTDGSEGQILFTFTGHEGSIFGVNISPPIWHPNRTATRLLASCSDDRTIRIWDLDSESIFRQRNCNQISARETGFGDNGEIPQTYDKCLAMAMGHASRIWRVKILVGDCMDPTSSPVTVLSFGEDSVTQQWALDISADSQALWDGRHMSDRAKSEAGTRISGTLNNMDTFAFHSGKHIWSAATRSIDHTQSVLITGGADGKISLYDVQVSRNNVGISESQKSKKDNFIDDPGPSGAWDLEEVLSTLPLNPDAFCDIFLSEPEVLHEFSPIPEPTADGKAPKKKKAKMVKKDAFNQYAFASENAMIVTTTFGRVLLGQIGGVIKWQELFLPKSGKEDIKSYTIVEGLPEIGLVFLAGTNGKIYAYHGDSLLVEVGSMQDKVADMFKIFEPDTQSFGLLTTTLNGVVATLFTIEKPDDKLPRFSIERAYSLPEKFVVTSASITGNIFVMGSRSGSLAIYDPKRPGKSLHIWNPDVQMSGESITSIIPLSMSSSGANKNYFLATSRKGIFAIFATVRDSKSNEIHSIHQIHHGTPPSGPMIDAAFFSESSLLLYGFKGKNFIVWNETLQCEIANIECGGSHRSYAYSPAGHFVYTKASKMYLHSQKVGSHRIVKSGGHGREIKTCAVSKDGGLIATGAEDTAIRIWSYGSLVEDKFDCLAVVYRHITGIQHLQWHGSNYLFSSGGNEEFFIWAIESIPGYGIGIVCEATCPDQTEKKDLRIMGFDISEVPGAEGELLASLAYSDSTIRIYTYSKSAGFALVATGRYTSSCMMQIHHIQILEDEACLLTAATDGNVTLWQATLPKEGSSKDRLANELLTLSTHKIHQSSIKSLDITTFGDQIVVATGGDDNALGITMFSHLDLSNPAIAFLQSAHSAAVTGLCFIPGEKLRVVSSSNDQRVKEWDITVDGDAVAITKVGDVFTAVADVGDVASLRDRGEGKVFVVGNGMEVWGVGGSEVEGVGGSEVESGGSKVEGVGGPEVEGVGGSEVEEPTVI